MLDSSGHGHNGTIRSTEPVLNFGDPNLNDHLWTLTERPLDEVVAAITDAEQRLTRLADSPGIADQPDRRWVDDWLHRSYQAFRARPR